MADDDEANAGSPALGDLHLAVSRRLRTAYVAALEPYGVSPHHARALRAVRDHGPIRPGRLAEALRIAPRSVTDVIDDLEGRGLVARAADPDDRRAQIVTMTDAGVALLAAIDDQRTDAASELFGRLSAGDRAELARILGSLLRDD